MTIAERDAKLGKIDKIPLTREDALFYRGRIDELQAVMKLLVNHYNLLDTDYEAFVDGHRPGQHAPSDQEVLLTYSDGLINTIIGFIFCDIVSSDDCQLFYTQQLPRLDFELNFPPRFALLPPTRF